MLAGVLFRAQLLSELETRSWDWRLAYIADPKSADPSIKIITIDQSSLERMAAEENTSWPWPRELYIPIIEFLKSAGARGVAFDIIYSERSHFSVHDDRALAESFAGTMPVVLAGAIRSAKFTVSNPDVRLFTERQQRLYGPGRPIGFEKLVAAEVPDVALPIGEFIEAAHAVGNVTIPNDSDGIFRHMLPGARVGEAPILSLPFALLRAADPAREFDVTRLNSRGEFTVKFFGPARTYRTYSYYGILRSFQALADGKAPVISPSEFKDSYVFVGMDAPGLLDLRPTPLSRSFPGVEYHATALDNALHNSFIRETSISFNLLFVAIFVVVGTFGTLFVTTPFKQACVALGAPTVLMGATFFAAGLGFWVPLMVPLLCTCFAIGAAFAYQYQLEGRDGRFLKNAFQFYLSPQLIGRIIEDASTLSLGGERKELTVFFCDIEGFTKMSESLDAQVMGLFLNEFLSEMTTIILEHQGTVDKYIGDAIVAFWNAPVTVAEHPALAVTSALECQRRIRELQDSFHDRFGVRPALRIGLNTGFVSVGNFGSRERFNYTVIGDVANVASRLEGANKFFGTKILVSENTFERLPSGVTCRKIANIRVVGRSESLRVYEPLIDPDPDELRGWNTVLQLLDGDQLGEARDMLTHLPPCKLYTLYLDRIAALESSGQRWDDVWNLSEK
jgi:adenylate cyclase